MGLSNDYYMSEYKMISSLCAWWLFLFVAQLIRSAYSVVLNLDLHVILHCRLLLYGTTSIKKISNHLQQCLVYFPSFLLILKKFSTKFMRFRCQVQWRRWTRGKNSIENFSQITATIATSSPYMLNYEGVNYDIPMKSIS